MNLSAPEATASHTAETAGSDRRLQPITTGTPGRAPGNDAGRLRRRHRDRFSRRRPGTGGHGLLDESRASGGRRGDHQPVDTRGEHGVDVRAAMRPAVPAGDRLDRLRHHIGDQHPVDRVGRGQRVDVECADPAEATTPIRLPYDALPSRRDCHDIMDRARITNTTGKPHPSRLRTTGVISGC